MDYTGWPRKNGTVDTVDFSELCSDHQLSLFTLLDRASFPHNNTKIIQFGWELFILWEISYGLSFSDLPDFQSFEAQLTLKLPDKLQPYGVYVYYVVHICDFGISRVKS